MIAPRKWPDLDFFATASVGEAWVDFDVYERYGPGGIEITPDIAEPDMRWAHGTVKWDGCSNWSFDCILHGCSRQDITNMTEVLARCWDWASELLADQWYGGPS